MTPKRRPAEKTPRLRIDPATGATILAPKLERVCRVCGGVLADPRHRILPPHPDWHAFEE